MEKEKISVLNYKESFWTKTIELTIMALVVLVPIIFNPYCITVFLPAKEFAAEVLIIMSLMFWAFKIVSREEIKFISTPLNFPILSLMAICTISLVWSNTFFISLKELPLFIAGPCLYFVVTNNIYNERQVKHILNILLFIGTLFGIYGIFQYNDMEIFTLWQGNVGRQRVFGLFGNVNYFAGYLIIPLSIAVPIFLTAKNRIRKILLLIGILTMGATLIFTFTRGSYLGFGVAVIFMFFLFLLSRGKSFIKDNKRLFIIILIVIIAVASLFTLPNPLNKPGTTISKLKERVSITKLANEISFRRRMATWKLTTLMIKDRPLLGSGIGTFKYNTLKYQAIFFEQGDNRSLYPHGFADKAHNEYLQLWAELGIVGLAIFIWLIIAYFNYGISNLKRERNEQKQGVMIGLMGAVVAVLVDGLFGFPLHLPATIVLFWLAIGLTVVMELKNNINTKKINISQFKLYLYIVIIFLTIFLCATMMRPFVARTYWYYGEKEIKNQNYDKAIEIYEEALKWDPYFGALYYDLGIIFTQRDLYDTALNYFKESKKYCDFPGLPQNFAIIYLAKGDSDKAIDSLKQAISYQRNIQTMPPLYNKLGNAYLRLENYELAEMTFKNALKIDPDFFSSHYGLANAYLRQNRIDEGLIELKRVVKLAPDSQEAKYARDAIQQIEQAKLKAQPTKTDN